jgi:molybdate transport system substrate-binding protein
MTAVSVISSMATRHILADLADAWKRNTGGAVALTSIGGVDAARRIRAGEPFDVAVLAGDALHQLAREGAVAADSLVDFAKSPAAVAVRAGAARPEACDAAALRGLLAKAQTVGVSTGPSGKAVRALLQAWGFAEPACRVVEAPPGVPVARLLASGEADVGFQQLSELLGEGGIDIVGAVPADVLPVTLFAMGRCRSATNVAGAEALFRFLASSAATPVKQRHGMQPA